MSEQFTDAPKPAARPFPTEPNIQRDFEFVDCSGLTRAIDLMESRHLEGESAVTFLRRELSNVQQKVGAVCEQLQQSSVELRQLRESAEREQVQLQDEQRQLQDQNDRFVANLIHEHDVEKATLRRERDAAIDRVRELSRNLTRAGTSSSASMQRVSLGPTIRSAPPPQDLVELRARLDELLYERDRSLRLLRQLAEQRDQAESRLQATLAALGTGGTASSSIERTVTIPNAEQIPNTPARLAWSQSPIDRAPGGDQPALTDPSHQQPQSNSLALASLGDPDNWDVGPPALSSSGSPAAAVGRPTTGTASTPSAAGRPLVLHSRFVKDEQDRSGAYSMVASELPSDEVLVSRPLNQYPKNK